MPESGSTDHLNVNTTQWEFSRWMMTENKNQNNIYYCDYGKNYTNSIYQITAAVLQLWSAVVSIDQKRSKEGTVVNQQQVYGQPLHSPHGSESLLWSMWGVKWFNPTDDLLQTSRVFHQDNAQSKEMVQEWFEILTFPISQSNQAFVGCLQDNLQDVKDLLLRSWHQIPQHTLKGLVEFTPWWVRAVFLWSYCYAWSVYV